MQGFDSNDDDDDPRDYGGEGTRRRGMASRCYCAMCFATPTPPRFDLGLDL